MRPALALVVTLFLTTSAGRADAQSPQAAMEDYFGAERLGGGVLIGMGAAGLTAGALLYADGGDHAKGASYPLIAFGLVHTAAGTYVAISATRRRNRLRIQLVNDEPGFLAGERPRMERVSRQLHMLQLFEIAIAGGGLAVGGIGYLADRDQLEGAGFALAAEAGATLLFDYFAARRADRYRAHLGVSAGTDPGTNAKTGWLMYSGAF